MDIFEALNILNDFILGGDSSVSGVNGFVSSLIPYCYILATIIMIILVGTKVISYFMNPSGTMDPYILVKPILIIVALSLYQPLVELLLVKPVNLITKIVESAAVRAVNAPGLDDFLRLVDSRLVAVQDVVQGDAGIPSIYDILQLSTILEVIHLLIQLVALVVNGYLLLRQILLKAIYLIIGVLVLPLSLAPGNLEVLKKWFFGFLSVLLWIPILRIFQTVIVLIDQAPVTGFAQPLYSVVLQIVMILFLLQVPKYANFLVSGSGDSDGNGYLMAAGRELYYNKISPKIWGRGGGMSSRENNIRNSK